MQTTMRVTPDFPARTVSRVLLIELGGVTFDVWGPLADSGTMPNVAELMRSAALVQLHSDGPHHESVAWATLETGGGPDVHGLLDAHYLDHGRRRILPARGREISCAGLDALVAAGETESSAVYVPDVAATAATWKRKPADFQQLSKGIAGTVAALRSTTAAALSADRPHGWRLFRVRFNALDSLLHRLWHLLGIGGNAGGNRRWAAKTREAFRVLDDCLGELLEMAERRNAAVVVVSPYGWAPFREKITLPELLRRRALLHLAGGTAAIGYRMLRLAWKARRAFSRERTRRIVGPVGALLPVDWRRTRALTFHGQSAALVYLNTPERFGSRVLPTRRQREQAEAEVTAALDEARHPITGERLFGEVYLSRERFGCDPLRRFWPDVVATAAPGFCTRHRLSRNKLLRPDASLVATRNGDGLLLVRAPGVRLGQPYRAELVDVATTVLALLGGSPAPTMTGRALAELFHSRPHQAAAAGRVDLVHNRRQTSPDAHGGRQ